MSIIYPLQTVIYNTMSISDPQKPEHTTTEVDWRSFFVRALSAGIFGFSLSSDGQFSPFVWDEPTSPGDRQNGGLCCVTGYWAPAHSMVKTSRGKAIIEFAPNDKPKGRNIR
mgnify:CR=1 FL=1